MKIAMDKLWVHPGKAYLACCMAMVLSLKKGRYLKP